MSGWDSDTSKQCSLIGTYLGMHGAVADDSVNIAKSELVSLQHRVAVTVCLQNCQTSCSAQHCLHMCKSNCQWRAFWNLIWCLASHVCKSIFVIICCECAYLVPAAKILDEAYSPATLYVCISKQGRSIQKSACRICHSCQTDCMSNC